MRIPTSPQEKVLLLVEGKPGMGYTAVISFLAEVHTRETAYRSVTRMIDAGWLETHSRAGGRCLRVTRDGIARLHGIDYAAAAVNP